MSFDEFALSISLFVLVHFSALLTCLRLDSFVISVVCTMGWLYSCLMMEKLEEKMRWNIHKKCGVEMVKLSLNL